jgi:Phage capsid family
MTPRPIPLRPDPDARRAAAVTALTRAAIAIGLSARDKTVPARDILKRQWGDDHLADLVLRAAVAPSTVANTAAITQAGYAFLDVLTPMSAGADLLQRGIQVSLDGVASVHIPGIAPATVGFVAEAMPIPAYTEPTSTGPVLQPYKLAALVALTNELMAMPAAEALIRAALVEAVGPALDAVLFGTAAATAAQPAGLRAGIAGLTPAATGAGKDQIIVDDLQALATAVAPVAGNNNIAIIASPDAAVALQLRLLRDEWPILVSSALAARTVIMIALNALVSSVNGPPEIEATSQAAYVPDTAPTDIVSSPGVVASSVISVFQTDRVALKLRWPITWALRDTRGLAWMAAVNW